MRATQMADNPLLLWFEELCSPCENIILPPKGKSIGSSAHRICLLPLLTHSHRIWRWRERDDHWQILSLTPARIVKHPSHTHTHTHSMWTYHTYIYHTHVYTHDNIYVHPCTPTHTPRTDHMHIHHTMTHVYRHSRQHKMHTCITTHAHSIWAYHMHMQHPIHTCVHTTNSTRVPYTQYIHTHMLAPFGHFIEESELLVCGVHLPGILFSCFQALHSFRIQNLALECGPGGGMTRLPPEWNQRHSAACFLILGTGQAFPPSAEGLCFRETKPEHAVSWSPRLPQILLLGCLS